MRMLVIYINIKTFFRKAKTDDVLRWRRWFRGFARNRRWREVSFVCESSQFSGIVLSTSCSPSGLLTPPPAEDIGIYPINFKKFSILLRLIIIALTFTACSKEINVNIPPNSQQIVVDGSIENNVPPIILLTKSQPFFSNANLNNLSAYFVHGAKVTVSGSDGTQAQLTEFCLQGLNLSPSQTQTLLSALGYSSIDSASVPNVCVYTVPDIINYYLTGTSGFEGKQNTAYRLNIIAPPITGHDSVHLTSTTTVPTALGMDSLSFKPDPTPGYSDSLVSVYANLTVPDTFGNFIRYKTKINSQPYYSPFGGDVYDDRQFVGLTLSLPLTPGLSPDATVNLNTSLYFVRGDTVTVKWSNIDANTYNFFSSIESDGGSSPFSSPVVGQTNITNGLGVWAGYATKYYTIIIPK